ncbi:MAG: pyruvate formate lyase family protein, partial [Peptococcales bacterium]
MSSCCVLSPQEARIEEELKGAKKTYGRERPFRILKEIQGQRRPIIDVERAKYFTESMKQTEGQPLILRWAKAMKHIAENITVYIDKDNLIVGRAGAIGRYGILYPELDGDFLDLAIQELPKRVESPFNITEEDARIV